MSNIAGKSYAMNVITPIKWYMAWLNRLIFWAAQLPLLRSKLNGLITLSLIHYARWALVGPGSFPRLDNSQPKETIRYTYMFFFSNFNGSWTQYVDSFHMAIPSGLDLLWARNVKYPDSVPLQPFHSYITYNQIWTNHYYNAYPLASSNDVKSAKALKAGLLDFADTTKNLSPDEFKKRYDAFLNDMQAYISLMEPTPIVSLAEQAVNQRRSMDAKQKQKRGGC
jgi:hypothetical protein